MIFKAMSITRRHLAAGMMKICVAGMLMAPCAGAAAERESNFDFTHHRAAVSGMLTSSYSWQVDLDYHYMLNPFIGIGGGIGSWKVYSVEGFASGSDWMLDSDSEQPWNIYLRPSVVLKSPALRLGQIHLGAYVEPGVMLNIPYTRVWVSQSVEWPLTESHSVSTSRGQWAAPDVRAGIYLNIGPLGINAGYLLSGFDVYSGYRHLSYRGTSFAPFYPRKSLMQGAFVTLAYYF